MKDRIITFFIFLVLESFKSDKSQQIHFESAKVEATVIIFYGVKIVYFSCTHVCVCSTKLIPQTTPHVRVHIQVQFAQPL